MGEPWGNLESALYRLGLFWFLFQKFFFLTLSKVKTLPSMSQFCPFLHTKALAASGRRGLQWRRRGSGSCAPSPAAGAVGVTAASAPQLQAQPGDLRAPGGCARPGQQGAAARGACQDADGAEEGGSYHGRPCSCSCVHPEAGWELALLRHSGRFLPEPRGSPR